MAKNIFFIGKGGVGKSTLSSLTSLYLAETSKVLLVSLDPAHNLSDIFQKRISHRETQITGNLQVKEIDEKKLVKNYLKESEHQLRTTYSYQTAFNLDKYYKILHSAPGIEEYALLAAFKDVTSRHKELHYIVFDMPPTALALKFFRLPSLSLLWLQKLYELRTAIIKKREIITRIRIGKKEIERDKVLNKLSELIADYGRIRDIFSSRSDSSVITLINPDSLSQSEHERIRRELQNVNIPVSKTILNKYGMNLSNQINISADTGIPQFSQSLTGIETLLRFISENRNCFQFITK